jgi:hypothetical protein
MTNTEAAAKITAKAEKLGLTPAQIAELLAFESSTPRIEAVEGGTVTTSTCFSAERMAARKIERAAELAANPWMNR